MQVWNPQLEHHLESFENQQDDDDCGDDGDEDDNDTDDNKVDTSEKIESTENAGISWLAATSMIILATSWCVGITSESFPGWWHAGMVLLCVILAIQALAWCRRNYLQYRIQKNQALYHSCRIQVSSMLGSIGAPPLQPFHHGDSDNTMSSLECKLVLDFARSHVELLKEVDECLHVLKTSVSISLRSTTRSVERVELSSLNRIKNKNVVLPTARRMLAQVMVDEYNTLQSVSMSHGSGGDNTTEMEEMDVPQVITLAWLKSLRLDLANLLSLVLSNLVVPDSTTLQQQELNDSIVAAQDSAAYLASVFDYQTQSSSCDDEDLRQLSHQLETAHIALWACHRSSNEENDKNTSDSQVLEFLEQFESLLQSTSDVKERLKQKCSRISDSSNETDLADNTEKGSPSKPSVETKEDYIDCGTVEDDLSQHQRHPAMPDSAAGTTKTIVFAGSGAVEGQTNSSNGGREAGIETDAIILPSQQYVASQGIVLQELQQRLAQMDPAEEVDASGNVVTKKEPETNAPIRREKDESPSSIMFMGSSNDLLSELKNSIVGQNDGGSAEVVIDS